MNKTKGVLYNGAMYRVPIDTKYMTINKDGIIMAHKTFPYNNGEDWESASDSVVVNPYYTMLHIEEV